MTFVVTARKWRPQKFGDVVGQEHITATLKNAIKNNRIAHAYLFTGPRGVGKTTTARIFAKALNCLNPQDAEPCNECEMCSSISSVQSLDIIEIDGASNRGIDEIRTLRESVKYAPTIGKYKVYIIDEVHMLTKESFNAFLKTLEEPPSHTIFIFATTDVHKVPLTIISRCQRYDFRRIQLDTIKSTLAGISKSENIEIDDKTLTIIAKKADGALRDAESFFDQVVSFCGNKIDSETVAKMLNLIDDEIYFRISDAVLEKNFKAVFDVTNIIYENGWDFIDFTNGLIEHFRNIMTVILTQKTDLIETADVYRTGYLDYIDKFSEGDILRLLNFLNKTHQELRYAQNHRLKIEIALSHLIGLEKTSTMSELISRVGNLPDSVSLTAKESFIPKSSYPSTGSSRSEVKESNPAAVKTSPAIETKVKQELQSLKTEVTNPALRKPQDQVSKVQAKEPIITNTTFNFDSVVHRWAGFVEAINLEKGFIVGPFIKSVKLLGLEGSNLNIYTNQPHSLSLHQEYITKKAMDFFGRKITFHLTKEGFVEESSLESESKEKEVSPKQKKPANDPLEDFIVDEMGGEEF